MAAVVLYLVSLLLFQQAVLCNSMVPQHDTRKSGWNHANSISKTRVLSDSMLFKSTKESKKTSTVPVFAANDLWSLLLGMKDNSPSETESKSKSNPSGLHRLQILTKSSSFLPGLSFLKIEKEPAKNYKTVRTELQPSTFSKKSSKQTAIRKLSHERGEIAKTSPTETMGTKTIRINENEIEQVFNSLQDQTIAPTTLPPLERTTGYNALLPTTVGSLLGLNLRLMNSISKQTEAVKAEPKYETIDKIKAQEPDMHVTDQANYHPSEPVEMRSLPDVSEQQIQKPNLVVNIKPTSQMKRHIDSQHKVQTKSNSFHPHTISNSSTDFIKGDVKASKQPVKVHDLQMNHPGSSNNGEFIIRQRTVDFMDPYTLEQQWLKKANMELKSKSKESSLRLNSIEPRTTLDLFDIQSAYKHMDLKISTSTSIPLPMSVNVKSKEGQGGQGHGWQGYDGHGHIGSRVTLESHHNNNQHDQHQISLHPERKFVERKNFNIKQIPQSSNNYVEPFANKLDVHANLKKHPLSGQHAGNRGLPYNIIKSAHKFSQSLISDKNQAGSILHSRMHTSPTVRPPKDLRPYHQLSPGGINWDFSETRSTGKEQHNGRQSRQQIDGSTTERPTTDWMSPKQQLPGGNTLEHYDNRQTGHRTQVTGNRGLPYNLIKSAHEFSQSLISDKNQAGSILHSRMHTSTTVRPPKDLRPYHQLSPGGINWDFSETRSTGKEQHNGRQSRQQIDGSTTERPTTDWMSPKQQLPGGNTLEHYHNRQTGHQQQHNGQHGGKHMQEMQWNVKQISQNPQNDQQNGDYPHLGQQDNPYSPYDYTQQLGEFTTQNNNNGGEQYGYQKQQYPQSNFNEQWNEGENPNTAWNQNPSYDANAGQYWSDGTYNNNGGWVQPDVNYQTNFEHTTQPTYEGGLYNTQTYQKQQPQTNFQMPAGWNIYSNVETQDQAEPHDPYSLSDYDEDSDESR